MRHPTLVVAIALALSACTPESSQLVSPRESWPGEDWATTDPADAGLDADALQALDAEFRAGTHGNVDSMLVIRNGRIVFERRYDIDYAAISEPLMRHEPGPYNYYDTNWHPYYKNTDLHTLQSTTKSFMSALAGIAIDRGELPGIHATLGELLPHREIDDERKAAITLENILRMQPGFEWEEDVSYWDPRNDGIRVESSDDWVAYLLDKPLVAEQGTVYKYNSTNTQLMSEIVSTATGMSLSEYADQHLFGPMGIRDYYWKVAPEGFNDVSGGLYMRPRDLARFALLFARRGSWQGQQLISADWVDASTHPHVPDVSPDEPESKIGYGYQWWVFRHGKREAPDMYGTWGWGGQFALVVPYLDLIGVFTGWNVYEGGAYRYAWDLFYDRIVLTAAREPRE